MTVWEIGAMTVREQLFTLLRNLRQIVLSAHFNIAVLARSDSRALPDSR